MIPTMQHVRVEMELAVAAQRAWETVVDVERYPEHMQDVKDAKILSIADDGERVTSWSVLLKGSRLEWTEREWIDHQRRRIEFIQLSGDLAELDGHWAIRSTGPSRCVAELDLRFDWKPDLHDVAVFKASNGGKAATLVISVDVQAASKLRSQPAIDITCRFHNFTIDLIGGAETFLLLHFDKLESQHVAIGAYRRIEILDHDRNVVKTLRLEAHRALLLG